MNNNRSKHWLLATFVLCMCATAALAQEQASVPASQASQDEQPQASQTTNDKRSDTIGERVATGNSNVPFVPSEEVSEDLSISFPADI